MMPQNNVTRNMDKEQTMNIVNHSKCKKCKKVRYVSELKDNPSGVGMICLDDVSCKKEQSKNKESMKIDCE
jgi:hypothetical protein